MLKINHTGQDKAIISIANTKMRREDEYMSIVLYFLDLFGGAIVSLPIVMIFAFVFDKERTQRKWLWLILYVLYLNAMLIIVGVPNFSYITWQPTINLIPFHDLSINNMIGMILNVVMLVPFGFFLPVYFVRYQKWYYTWAAGFLMSLLIEVIQLFTFRASDIDDLLMNTLGTVIGFALARMFLRHRKNPNKDNKDWIKLIAINSIILAVIVFIRYPMMDCIYSLI